MVLCYYLPSQSLFRPESQAFDIVAIIAHLLDSAIEAG